ncbi:MAG TPA: alpha/beta hydrolase [Mucilaginibacter sp.]|nr:alpha/beta hydrolase [Mucilaginibacter sp.]
MSFSKKNCPLLCCILATVFMASTVVGQSVNPKIGIFPKGTHLYGNIPYANDTLKKHLLDIYLPPAKKKVYPLIVWIHGGAWMLNDKYADMSYMTQTLKAFADSGYAIASIDYRYSTTAKFPAQIQDCNQAIQFLYDHAKKYSLDRSRIALIGFSAGGHLASLLALSNNNHVQDFYPVGTKSKFKIRLCLDFYGPADFTTLTGKDRTDAKSPVSLLLGGLVDSVPEIAKKASPVTYIDKHDPPFLIVQGEKDESVNPEQSKLMSTRLSAAGINNKLIIVPGAPHYGVMFDADYIRENIFKFLNTYLK